MVSRCWTCAAGQVKAQVDMNAVVTVMTVNRGAERQNFYLGGDESSAGLGGKWN